jgi:hypothetical protein
MDRDAPNACLDQPALTTPAAISQAVAECTTTAAAIYARYQALIQAEVDAVAMDIGHNIGKLLHWIETEVAEIMAEPGRLHNRIQVYIDNQCAPIMDVCGQYGAMVDRAAKKARKKSPCATEGVPQSAPPAPTMSGAGVPTPIVQPADSGASPLAGMWLPSDDAGQAVELVALPQEWWGRGNPQGWYLTLARDESCRCGCPVLKVGATGCDIVGTLWVAETMDLPAGACEEVLRLLGVPDDAVISIAPPEPVTAAAAEPAKADQPSAAQRAGQALGQVVGGGPDVGAMITEARALLRMLADLVAQVQRWLSSARLPTRDEICALLEPVYAAIGLPDGLRPVCDDMPAALASIRAMLEAA